jgi:hypothetical protein
MHLASLSAVYSTRVDATSEVQYEVTAKVPAYSTDPAQAYAIDQRMKELGRLERYDKELSKITKAKNLPPEWATLEQRSRAALKALTK